MSAVVRQSCLVFRQMREADVDRVIEIEQGGYDFPWSAAIFTDCLRVGYHCSVLTDNDEIVGYSIVSFAAGEAHLLNLCVASAHADQGHGSSLVSRVMDDARKAGCSDIFLEVRPSNHKAMRLYHRFGFRLIGTRPRYYRALNGREDAHVLTASLDAVSHDGQLTLLPCEIQGLRH